MRIREEEDVEPLGLGAKRSDGATGGVRWLGQAADPCRGGSCVIQRGGALDMAGRHRGGAAGTGGGWELEAVGSNSM